MVIPIYPSSISCGHFVHLVHFGLFDIAAIFGLFGIAAIFGLFGIAAIQSFSSHTGINLNVVSFNLDLHQNLVIAIIEHTIIIVITTNIVVVVIVSTDIVVSSIIFCIGMTLPYTPWLQRWLSLRFVGQSNHYVAVLIALSQ